MPLEVALVTDPKDLEQISPMAWDAWKVPYNPQLKHFRPQLPTRDENIAYATERDTEFLNSGSPNLFMVKVTDTETNEIIGMGQWVINDPENSNEGPTVATYYPEGSEEREFAETFINGLWGFLGERVPRKHMDLLSLTVDTRHRFRGAGRLLIRWGIEKADELGIETVISSLKSARPAYERSGLGYIEDIPPAPELQARLVELEKAGRGDKWRQLLEDDLCGCLMWRPIGRDWKEGDRAPWMSS